jgi:hypothetical protein
MHQSPGQSTIPYFNPTSKNSNRHQRWASAWFIEYTTKEWLIEHIIPINFNSLLFHTLMT